MRFEYDSELPLVSRTLTAGNFEQLESYMGYVTRYIYVVARLKDERATYCGIVRSIFIQRDDKRDNA